MPWLSKNSASRLAGKPTAARVGGPDRGGLRDDQTLDELVRVATLVEEVGSVGPEPFSPMRSAPRD